MTRVHYSKPDTSSNANTTSDGDQKAEEKTDKLLLDPEEQLTHFDPMTYLKEYYSTNDMLHGLKAIITFLPNIAARIPRSSTFLDVGSGPTVYMAMGLRNKVDAIYLSDYAAQNRKELLRWCQGESSFNWTPIADAISKLEGSCQSSESVQMVARHKVKAILKCNILTVPSLPVPYSVKVFDIVSSIFCLEYATVDLASFQQALKNVVSMIRKGGWLILGGAFHEHSYDLGYCRFLCLYLNEQQLMESLQLAGINTDAANFYYWTFEDAYVVLANKT